MQKLSKTYPSDPATYFDQIRKITSKFTQKKPKIENNINETMKIFHEYWSKYLTLPGFENNNEILR